ncbi:MAG: competence/damage-inducible protein A [Oscillospiraceae bacterium]|nr:competence/damage-inducible protein A [Oscillospiraceae bacterium]
MSYCAEIIAVGTEILLGDIVNTDAQTVARALGELGINVYYNTVVGDNPERLRAAVEIAKSRADIIITTGGLGPTFDDLTKQTLAECFGKKLVLNETELEKIRGFFAKIGREMTKNNEQQAYLPEDCVVLENDWGTAPGCAFFAENTHVLMLPGPPRECKPMVQYRVIPYLKQLSDASLVSHELKIFGMGESSVEDKVRHIAEHMTNPTLAPYAKEGETLLRVTGRAENEEAADALTRPVIDQVYEILGEYIYGMDVPSLADVVFRLLKEQGLTLATAESCTGGLLSKMITDLPGVSEVFLGGVCAYQNEIKEQLLGVPHEILETKGAVSEECAAALAEGARKTLGADIGVGITGIAGPGGGTEEKPVGTVYVAVANEKETRVVKSRGHRDRGTIRNMAALTALDQIRRLVAK